MYCMNLKERVKDSEKKDEDTEKRDEDTEKRDEANPKQRSGGSARYSRILGLFVRQPRQASSDL